MVAQKVLITIAYDAGKGLLGSFLKDRDHDEAVSDAASTVASPKDGISTDDLLDVFKAELDEEVLNSAGTDKIKSELAHALKIRANTTREVDYEGVITRFLDELEQNLVAQGRPEEGVQVLYEYARETNHLAENLQDEIERLHQQYHDDLTTLSNRSRRVVPDENQYRLPEIDKHIDQPATSAIQRSISDGENVILTGPAGVGKSGILAELYHTWNENQPIYFLDAREFGSIDSRRDIESELGLRNPITDVFSRIADNSIGCVLVVDQLDNVRTERGVPNIFENFLLDLADIDALTVVCACRDWDLNQQEYQGLQDADDFSRIEVESLAGEQIERTLSELGIEEAAQNEHLVELCQSLLNLSLLADVVAQNGDIDASTITEKITLWEKYRESLNKEGSEAHGKIPRDWDESPVDRAVRHARSSLQDSKTTFRIDKRDPGDQRLLSRETIEQEWRQRYRFRHDQLQSYFYAWKATADDLDIQNVLKDGLDELIAADVFEWMLQFYLERPSRSASFIRDALGSDSELGFYARTIIADTARSLGPGTLGEDVTRTVVESLNTDWKLAREFYRELESPNWAKFLVRQELLSETGFHAAQYIARLAEAHPQIVIDAMESYDSVEVQIVQTYLPVLGDLERNQLATAAQTIEDWIRNVEIEEMRRVERDLTEFVNTLVEYNQPEMATDMISLLVEPVGIEIEEQELSEYTHTTTTIESRVRSYTLQNFFEEYTEELAEICGIQLLDPLEIHFRSCLNQLKEAYESDIPPEQTLKRRTTRMTYQATDLEEILSQAIEDILTHQVSMGVNESISRVEEYVDEGGIFRQIAIHALGQNPNKAADLVSEILRNWSAYEEGTTETEYIYLLKNGFETLSDQDKREIIKQIEEGPDKQEIREFLRSHSGLEADSAIEEAVESRVEQWKLKRFYHIRRKLSDSKQEYIQELIDQHGEVEYDIGSGYHISHSFDDEGGEESFSFEDLDAEDFISSCIEYSKSYSTVEEDEEKVLSGPRPKLSRELRERILSKPTVYIPQIPDIIATGDDMLAETAFSAIGFLITGVNYQDTTIKNWSAIITAGTQFCSQSPLEENWSLDCRRSFADTVRIIIGHVRSSLRTESYESELSNILLTLLTDADDGVQPHSVENALSIPEKTYVNGVRAVGVVATIHFFRDSHRESYKITSEQQLWEHLQELATDNAEPVRAGFGKMLPSLYVLNEDFVNSKLDDLLPVSTDSADIPLFVSTWQGYMTNTIINSGLFNVLKSRYKHAIKLHKDFEIESHDQTFESLCSHLAIAYASTDISYSDDLFQSVFTVSVDDLNPDNPASADHHFAGTFADLLSNTDDRELEKQRWKRVIGFWQKRLDDSSSRDTGEFAKYGRILFHPPQSASLEDISDQLKQSAPSIASSLADRRVMEFIADEVRSTTRSDVLNNAIEITDEIIEHTDIPYIPASDERWTVVKSAAEDGNDLALEVAQKLFESGEPEYKRIIDRHKVDE
jgi:energy-coupling factor transporter ATP-binding protein EcfA2